MWQVFSIPLSKDSTDKELTWKSTSHQEQKHQSNDE